MSMTIDEVLSRMRNTAVKYYQGGNKSKNVYELLMLFHRDIVKAVKLEAVAKSAATTPTCKDSLQVQTMDDWAYPLTNVCKCGNNQEAKPCASVKDTNGVVILHFIGSPWRSNEKATAMAMDFCHRMNMAHRNKVGNAAAMRAALQAALPIMRDCPFTHYNTTEVDKVVEEMEAALSSPPRNCDLFGGDPKKLHELWWEWSGDLKNCNADGTVKLTYGEWLLKPANAKGGEK
jgi:hypothetical protein